MVFFFELNIDSVKRVVEKKPAKSKTHIATGHGKRGSVLREVLLIRPTTKHAVRDRYTMTMPQSKARDSKAKEHII